MAVVAEEIRDELGVKPPDELISWLNVLIYGEPGVGKTWLCGTADDDKATSPVLFMDVEGGVTTLRKRTGLDVVSVRNMTQIVEIHRKLHENPGYYKTVVIDSLTELQKLDMREIMKEASGRNPNQDEDVPSMREWGKSGERIRRVVRAYRDLPLNTIFTAHTIIDKDANNATIYSPSLPGKLRAELPGFLDIVGFMYTFIEDDNTIRRVQFQKTKTVTAKDRTDELGPYLDNTSIPFIWNMIHNNKGAK